jgi:hypothetical protein
MHWIPILLVLLLYMFRAAFLPIIRSSWPYIGFGTFYAVVMNRLLPGVGWMMCRKAARNMYSSNTNKIGIQCICWFYSHFIVHNANGQRTEDEYITVRTGPMFALHVLNQVLKCQYRVLGICVGRKLTATRAITFGEDNHSFALTKDRCHSNDNTKVYGSKCRGTLHVDGDELLRRKCDRLHGDMPVSFVKTSFRTFTFLPCDLQVHRSTLGSYLVAAWSSDRSCSQLPFTICRDLNAVISRRITEIKRGGGKGGDKNRYEEQKKIKLKKWSQ